MPLWGSLRCSPMIRVRFTGPAMLALVVALALAAPGGARASSRQVMILQDDANLVYASPQKAAQTLSTLKGMGVDRVRISVVWQLLAPRLASEPGAEVRRHQPQRLSPGRVVSLRLPGPRRDPRRSPGVLPADRPGAQLGHHAAQAGPGLPVLPRPQRHGVRAVRPGGGPALRRQLRAARRRGGRQAPGRPLLGNLERAEHQQLDDPAVEHDQGRREGAGLPGDLPRGWSTPPGTDWSPPATATTRS